MRTAQSSKTPSRKRQPKQVDAKRYQEIIESLDKFFGVTPYKPEWSEARNGRVGLLITYTDFLSEPLVRKMLTDIVPAEILFMVKREYSDKAVAHILLQEFKKNRVAVVDCYGGQLRPETIHDFVYRKLELVEMM